MNKNLNKFFFCDVEMPLHANYWFMIKHDLWKDEDNLNFWEIQIKSYFNEIEWKLDKEGYYYTYESDIYQICSLYLLRHVILNKDKLSSQIPTDINAQNHFLDDITNSLFNSIELCQKYDYVWWILGNDDMKNEWDNEIESIKKLKSSSYHKPINNELEHLVLRESNIQFSIKELKKDIRRMTNTTKNLPKELKRQIQKL